MNEPTIAQIRKLPKWTQDYIRYLQMQIDKLKFAIDDIGSDDTPITATWTFPTYKIGIPKHSSISFAMKSRAEFVINYDDENDRIIVREVRIGDRVVIMPEAANSFYISTES